VEEWNGFVSVFPDVVLAFQNGLVELVEAETWSDGSVNLLVLRRKWVLRREWVLRRKWESHR
jgi:hypothetical protein